MWLPNKEKKILRLQAGEELDKAATWWTDGDVGRKGGGVVTGDVCSETYVSISS